MKDKPYISVEVLAQVIISIIINVWH